VVTDRLTLVSVLALGAAACTRTLDPCGEGTYRQGKRCVAVGLDASGAQATGVDAAPADAEWPPLRDAGMVAMDAAPSRPEAGTNADGTVGDEAGRDADAAGAGTDARA
jgi:hypothetical protein